MKENSQAELSSVRSECLWGLRVKWVEKYGNEIAKDDNTRSLKSREFSKCSQSNSSKLGEI
jgi:hypothetical protein